MKCEKCGNNEAVFFYSTDINGEKSQGCLCEDCAHEMGLCISPMYRGRFGQMYRVRLLSGFGNFGAPVGSIMAPSMAVPFVNAVCGEDVVLPREDTASSVPADAGADIKRRRELAALREQLNSAVSAEDYEKAAELRDKLRAMEKED